MNARWIWFAFGIGASLGAGIALLYAPQTGAKTRKQLGRGLDDAADYLEDVGDYLKEQAEKLRVKPRSRSSRPPERSMTWWMTQSIDPAEP